MTIIRSNSISGINSITAAPGANLQFFDSTGASLSLDTGNVNAGVVTATTVRVTGDLTVEGTTTTLDTVVTEVDKLEVNANTSTVGVAITQSGTGDILRLYDGASQVVTVDDQGNFGIKTTNPTQALTLRGEQIIETNSTAADSGNGIYWQSTTNGWNTGQAHAAIFGKRVDANNGYFRIDVREGGTTSEKLRITSTGNVGIGTDNPGRLLNLYGATTPLVRLTHTTASSYAGLEVYEGATQKAAFNALGSTSSAYGGSNAIQVWNFMDAPIVFATNNSERLRISSDGTIGIGKEPSSWDTGSSTTAVQIENSILFDYVGAQFDIGHNYYYDGSAYRYISDGYCSRITQHKVDGTIRFWSGGTGVADATYSWSERLRITSGGKVFLPGTQTDSNEAGRLDIYHTADDGINNPHIRLWGPENQDARIEFGSPTNTGEGGYIMYNDSDEGLYIGSRMGGYGEVNLCTGMSDGSPTSNIRLRVTSGGHTLFSGLTSHNDSVRNPKGITVKSGDGISFQNFGANGSRNWRLRPDDLSSWGSLEFSVSPTDNDNADWPDALSDVVLELKKDKNVKITNGNLIIGTSGNGIDFSATSDASGSTSELLDDYEEGTFTPRISVEGQSDAAIDNVSGTYVKVGQLVHCTFNADLNGIPAGRGTSFAWQWGGLPFTSLAEGSDGSEDYIGSARIGGADHTSTYGVATFILRLFDNATGGRIEAMRVSNGDIVNASLYMKDNTSCNGSITYRTS